MRISVSIVIQAVSQLKAKYEKEWADIVGNCDTLLFLGTQDIETAKFITERIGKATVVNKTRSLSMPIGNSARGSKGENEGKTGRLLLTPDEVTRLNPGKSIIFIQGLYPVLAEKYNLKEHKLYKNLYEADHNQYNPDYSHQYGLLKPSAKEGTIKEQKKTAKNPKENVIEKERFLNILKKVENTNFGGDEDEEVC